VSSLLADAPLSADDVQQHSPAHRGASPLRSYAPYDRSGKWLIEHHGESILRPAGIRRIVDWRPVPGEVVQPRQLPDGLLEVLLRGRKKFVPFVVELATYPEKRLVRQLVRQFVRHAMLVYLDRETLPEIIAVILRPKGRQPIPTETEIISPLDGSRCRVQWRVVKLWEVPSAELLKSADVGLVPWVPLTNFSEPPAKVIEECRRRIDAEAPENERQNLLAVTQVLTRLRYNNEKLFQILGGGDTMLESPFLDELIDKTVAKSVAKAHMEDIFDVLEARFGSRPDDLADELRAFGEQELKALNRFAAVCPDLEAFRARVRESK
jgi:hypothetical protein